MHLVNSFVTGEMPGLTEVLSFSLNLIVKYDLKLKDKK